ncbi:MAG: ABC transporter ATP-binding protein [Desulfosarcina sp.]|nr:ABC transporter ATP-binding protein [Desulfobacterales bacterium]
MFDITDLNFGYSQGRVLEGLSLELGAGRFYGLLGPNGCGKTTLLDLMAGLQRPISGQIIFKGQPLGTWHRRQLAREIALVPQNYYVNFPFVVQEVVMMGRYPHLKRFAHPGPEDRRRVQNAMEATDIVRFAHQPVTTLSGGERQRVIFARALAQNTGVLMLDEATSNLDIRHTLNLLNRVRDRVRNRQQTVIAVFQDINLAAMYCDDLLFFQDGRIAVQGPTVEVMRAETLQSIYGVDGHIRPHAEYGLPQVDFRR